MNLVSHPSPRKNVESELLVLLPGFDMRADDFVAHGFVATLHDRADAVDLIIAEPDLDSYMDGTIARRLLEVIANERHPLYRRIWLGGISLGSFGALLAAASGPERIDGIVLLSPYLGNPGLIAEVERAGGLSAWQPGAIADNDGERRVLGWLRSYVLDGRRRPLVQLGYGRSDRFVAAATLLAACLPASQVHIAEGGHDWPTWATLWRHLLDARPFFTP